MLSELKKEIQRSEAAEVLNEAMIGDAKDDAIKDALLDDIDFNVAGAENDPQIAKLVEEIPEYDNDGDEDGDLHAESTMSKLTEGLLETNF